MSVPVEVKREASAALLRSLILDRPARCAPSTLYAFLATVSVQFPDEFWSEAVDSAKHPCGVEGCECEKIRELLMSTLSAVREDGIRVLKLASGEKGLSA